MQLVFTVEDFLDTWGRSFDVSADGTTLFAVKSAKSVTSDRVHFVSNLFDNLDRFAPTQD